MNQYSSFQNYQNAVIRMQQLYQLATVTTSSEALDQLLQEAEALANPSSQPISPDAQKAQDLLTQAQQLEKALAQELSLVEGKVCTLESQIEQLSSQIASLKKIIDSGSYSPEVAALLQKTEGELAAAQAALAPLQNRLSNLDAEETSASSLLSQIQQLAQSIIQGTSDDLATLSALCDRLGGMKDAFESHELPSWNSSLDALKSQLSQLTADATTLQQNINPSPSANGNTTYLDMNVLTNALNQFMIWWPDQKLDMAKVDQYLSSLISQLKAAGISQIDLGFLQISDIDNLELDPGIQELIKMAHQNGMKVDLSFGGEDGTAMQICKGGETPSGQAMKLAQFIKDNGIDAVDFDIENGSFSQVNAPQDARLFFQTLHSQLGAEGKTMALTIMGSIGTWAKGFLKELFYDDNGAPIFSSLFDDLNLMLYSMTQGYISADNPDWGIEGWLDVIGHENASKLHVGFEDMIDYSQPGAIAGQSYPVDTTDSGTAAAEIYKQLLQQLEQAGYPSSLGNPFFWPDLRKHTPDTWNRYQPIILPDGSIGVNFDTDMIGNFAKEM